MNIAIELAKRNISVTVEEFNSNNGWGFGGAHGKRFHFEHNGVKFTITEATASYRHLPPTKFIAMTKNGKRVIDEFPPAGKKQLVTFFNTL